MRVVLLFLLLSALMDGVFSLEFSFVPIKKKWLDAQKYCRNYFTDLITINNLTENEEVLAASGNTSFWIGLLRTNLYLIWSDRSKVTFVNWATETTYNPHRICVLSDSGGWHSMSCELEKDFVCYSAPPTVKKTQILRLEVTSDENVKHPEVKKKVLEKIQQILKMKGLDGNATLSWRNQSDGNVFQKYQENNVTQQICP